ncbi:MAG: VanW family protein [Chloroflexia bacterium]|nr:VanW family protein [Chloroflexia bacterium]
MSSRQSSSTRQPHESYSEEDWAQLRPDWLETWRDLEQSKQPIHPARRRRRRRLYQLKALWVALGVLLTLGALALGLLYTFEWRFDGVILPNVYVGGIPLGELSPTDARALLQLHYRDFQQQPLALRYEDRVWRPSGPDIGLQVAWDAAVDEAMSVGREGSFWERCRQRWRLWQNRHDILLPVWLEEGLLRHYLEDLALTIDRPPLDAALAVENQDVYVRSGQDGHSLQIVPSQVVIKRALSELSTDPVDLVVHIVPANIDETAASGALETARRMLSGPIILHIGEQSWTLSVAQIGEMLTIERRQEGLQDRLGVFLDQEALFDFMQEIASAVRVRPRNAHFCFVEDHLEIVDEGATGQELQVDAAVEMINSAVLSDQRELELNVVEVQPEIRRETIAELGIQELVGYGESYFSGSPAYRLHNIANAARILDGTLIAPGETFSFIGAIGPIDEDDGFIEGYSIIGGRTVLNVGGGVCQVSTTVFRAAFFAGLPIVERHAHAFRVSYYEQGSILGFDATIYTGTGTDLRFRNDTDGYLLMQLEAYTHSAYLQVSLYGTRPDRQVQLDGPYLSNWTPAPSEPVYVEDPTLPPGAIHQTDWAHDGVDATIYRHILVNGEVVSSESFYSHYEAWPNVYAIGP